MKRIYHHWTKLEEYKNGMWKNLSPEKEKQMLVKAIAFTGDTVLYGDWMMVVIVKWPYSCEHNLTCQDMNRQAWVGHAACCLAIGCPEHITRLAWHQLSTPKQINANLKRETAWPQQFGIIGLVENTELMLCLRLSWN